jgi:murein lipoprotein
MKKSLLVFSMMLVLSIAFFGCASTSDLEKLQAQQNLNSAKTDQAVLDAQNAKASADAAAKKADEAIASAQAATKAAEDRAKAAEEKAKLEEEKAKLAEENARLLQEKAKSDEALFQKSMKK